MSSLQKRHGKLRGYPSRYNLNLMKRLLLGLGVVGSIYILLAATWFGHSLGIWPSLKGVLAPDWTEAVGFVFGVWAVYLTVLENVWNWPIGIINSAFYVWVFATAKLYMDTGLSVVYVILGIYGWYWWLFGGQTKDDLPITHTPREQHVVLGLVTLCAGALMWRLNLHLGGSAPIADAALTAISLLAQYMLTRKYIENWVCWIIADVCYIPLFFWKGLNLTGLLYFIFLGLAISGYLNWRKLMAEQSAVPSA